MAGNNVLNSKLLNRLSCVLPPAEDVPWNYCKQRARRYRALYKFSTAECHSVSDSSVLHDLILIDRFKVQNRVYC